MNDRNYCKKCGHRGEIETLTQGVYLYCKHCGKYERLY